MLLYTGALAVSVLLQVTTLAAGKLRNVCNIMYYAVTTCTVYSRGVAGTSLVF